MRVLVIKLTSMGDVIHTLPALSDAQRAIPGIEFDFVVEESFQEIPAWHPAVKTIIPVATRRWRKSLISSRKQISEAVKNLREEKYDAIIDAQGLLKSAFIASLSKGIRHGFDSESIREPLATRLYQKTYRVDQSLHAIARIRQLFARALKYSQVQDQLMPEYGLTGHSFSGNTQDIAPSIENDRVNSYMLFLHGTTWRAKEWPVENWCALAKKISISHQVFIPWGNEQEKQRATKIAENFPNVEVLPKLNLSSLANLIAGAVGIVAVDTGLGHLAAALGTPTVSIYGPTDTQLIGTLGENQVHMCATQAPNWRGIKKNEPFDYGKISAEVVYEQLQRTCS